MSKGRKRRRLPRMVPPPCRSERVYVKLPRANVARLRFFLEGYDNLGYATVLDPWEAVAVVVFSPSQRREMLAVLEGLAPVLGLEMVPLPAALHSQADAAAISAPPPMPE